MTISKENFLKVLYHLSEYNNDDISIKSMAEALNISKPAITDMAKKMHTSGWISYIKYKGITITNSGKHKALMIIRKHRLWESFLIETLDYNWDEVHDEAEMLEHSTSDQLINRIDHFLNYPTHDPHGDPIPNKQGKLPTSDHIISLKNTIKGKKYSISRITNDKQTFIQFLSRIGIQLKKEIIILDKLNFDNSINIMIDKKEHVLSNYLASHIYVETIQN